MCRIKKVQKRRLFYSQLIMASSQNILVFLKSELGVQVLFGVNVSRYLKLTR